MPAAVEEIRRVVTVFRELRSGQTADGRTKLKSPSGTLSTAEAISVITNGLALAAHFGDGMLHPSDIAAGIMAFGRARPGGRPDGVGRVPRGGRPRAQGLDRLLQRLPRGHRVTASPDLGTGPSRAKDRADTGESAGLGPHVEVMGVRHHGPGSARAVRAALDRLQPDVVLIEGPADADSLTVFTVDDDLEPPVALLAYAIDAPTVAAFWPFAVFSPEWQALRWAAAHGVPVRFCDLPTGAVLAHPGPSRTAPETAEPGEKTADEDDGPASPAAIRRDPVAALAHAAGYADPERWWDDVVESRLDAPTPFPVLTEAMTELRASAGSLGPAEQEHEDRREAYMRQTLRKALRDGVDHRRGDLRRLARAGTDRQAPAGDCGRPAAARHADPQDLRHLGAVELVAACPARPATGRGSPHPAGTTTCSPRPTT